MSGNQNDIRIMIENLRQEFSCKLDAVLREHGVGAKHEPKPKSKEQVDREIPEAALGALREFHRHWTMTAAFINSNADGAQGRAFFNPRTEPLEDPKIEGEILYSDKSGKNEDCIIFDVEGEDDLEVSGISVHGTHSVCKD